ncbi:MAG: aminoacyl-tRNA hydrolase [Planctomycetota bacterium]
MRVLFGIGNPGPEYDGTRHNLGFELLDRFAPATSYDQPHGLPAAWARADIEGEPLLLVRPLTYVNRCGPLLASILSITALPRDRCLVAVDDLDLPPGDVRLRGQGSAGGHNGLRSLEEALGGRSYPRLRLGIGGPGARAHPDYVLGRFPEEERAAVDDALARAAEAVRIWAVSGLDAAMGEVNRRQS